MPFIIYSSVNSVGGVTWHHGIFPSLEALYSDIRKREENIDQFYEFPEFFSQLVAISRRSLNASQVIEFCNYLSVYIQGGLDLQTALSDLAVSSPESTVRATAERIRTELFSGLSLSTAMEQTRQFPEIAISMARIGERTGNLDQMLEDASAYLGRIQEIKSTTRRAMIYPLVSIGMLLLTGAFWMLVVVPRLAQVFKTMDIQLPWPTRALIAFSDFLKSGWPLMIFVPVALFFIYTIARRQRGIRQTLDRISWGFPIFGYVVRSGQSAFYFQYLALVYRAGVPIADAVNSIIETSENRFFRGRISRIPEHLRMGLSLREAFQRCNIFAPLDVRMVSIGEQTGSLDKQLGKLAELYMKRVQAAVELLTKSIEPMLMIVMGFFFIIFVVAMMMPIYELVSKMMSNLAAGG